MAYRLLFWMEESMCLWQENLMISERYSNRLYYILWLVNNKHYFHTFTGAKGKVGSTGNNYKENQGFLKSFIKSNYQTNIY